MNKSTDTRKPKRTFNRFPMDIYTSKMSDEMQAFGFPCGETDCYETAQYELHFDLLWKEKYTMPICFEHEAMAQQTVEKLNEILDKAEKECAY